jgi:hypothetical protein
VVTVFTEREERASTAIASNAPFSEWTATFSDPRLCAAIVDRLTYDAHIIQTGSGSYRLRVTAAAARLRDADSPYTLAGLAAALDEAITWLHHARRALWPAFPHLLTPGASAGRQSDDQPARQHR